MRSSRALPETINTSPSCHFFFQAEDGIRDLYVTGVQTCALPIFRHQRQHPVEHPLERREELGPGGRLLDRKSTRLNSSHVEISYAVFCLKKKKKKKKKEKSTKIKKEKKRYT